MTNGDSSFYEADREGRLLRESGVSVVVIGVGDDANRDLLSAIADNEDSLFFADDFAKLLSDTSLIQGRSCLAAESTLATFLNESNLHEIFVDGYVDAFSLRTTV